METRAYLGNHAWKNTADYAPHLDIVQRPRSTGSILKPLLYGLMLQEGELLPTTLVPDLPTRFGGYSPQNYDRLFRGAVPAHVALSHSLNVPAVRMLRDYGIARFHHHLQDLGMSTLFRAADDYGLTLILGGAEGTLWEMTAIYARLAASARDGEKKFFRSPALLSADKKEPAFSLDKSHHSVIDQGAAWLTLQALVEVTRPGHESL